MQYILEVIAYNIASCIIAQENGADRIELCANPAEGGTTPSYGMIRAAKEKCSIPVYVMIRPRGGDFLYSDEEYGIMQEDIIYCRDYGCDGVVLGLLLPDGTIDIKRTKALVQLAYPMEVTFHRAFDRVKDAHQSLEDVIECGCTRILTSGLKPTAAEGVSLIRELIELADERIIIMPGSGVRSSNIEGLIELSGAVEFHTSAGKMRESGMEYRNGDMGENLNWMIPESHEIQAIKQVLFQHT
jgi:copper homeostasis protein